MTQPEDATQPQDEPSSAAQASPALYGGYFADPFVLWHAGLYYAYGTGLNGRAGKQAFEVLSSPDLRTWTSHGGVLTPYSDGPLEYWAPEVAVQGGHFYMYYSAGLGDVGHHLRVAVADGPLGPFQDQGLNLTPGLPFAIDPSPFLDEDGQWYLYFARDLLDGERPGTSLAVQPLGDMTRLRGEPVTVLRASADWQRYAAGREMPVYGGTYDWHTLEGAFVVRRGDTYHLFYSGGAWTDQTYGVGHATAPHPLGPWSEPAEGPVVLRSGQMGLRGPGHISVVRSPGGQEYLAYHAWDEAGTRRLLHVAALDWGPGDVPTLRALG